MRYAIYFTPPEHDPLTRAAARWLGRGAFGGEPIAPRDAVGMSAAEIAYMTAAARRYGFHATLKAPFRLAEAESEAGLDAALARFCAGLSPFEIRLVLDQIDGFFALVPEHRDAALDALAREVVTSFERFRAPLSEAEIARRAPDALSPAQLRNLHQWGYPYVLDQFRFHMTLTGRVDVSEAARARRAIEAHFGPLLDEPVEVGGLALFVESESGAPFAVRSYHPFAALPQRKTA